MLHWSYRDYIIDVWHKSISQPSPGTTIHSCHLPLLRTSWWTPDSHVKEKGNGCVVQASPFSHWLISWIWKQWQISIDSQMIQDCLSVRYQIYVEILKDIFQCVMLIYAVLNSTKQSLPAVHTGWINLVFM